MKVFASSFFVLRDIYNAAAATAALDCNGLPLLFFQTAAASEAVAAISVDDETMER